MFFLDQTWVVQLQLHSAQIISRIRELQSRNAYIIVNPDTEPRYRRSSLRYMFDLQDRFFPLKKNQILPVLGYSRILLAIGYLLAKKVLWSSDKLSHSQSPISSYIHDRSTFRSPFGSFLLLAFNIQQTLHSISLGDLIPCIALICLRSPLQIVEYLDALSETLSFWPLSTWLRLICDLATLSLIVNWVPGRTWPLLYLMTLYKSNLFSFGILKL
jgi:hypothetical protein